MLNYPPIDRHAEIRNDKIAINNLQQAANSRTILWHKGQVLVKDKAVKLFQTDELETIQGHLSEPIYLGKHDGSPYFTCHIDKWTKSCEAFETVNLRTAGLFVTETQLGLLFYSQGLFNWHRSHQFCANCGSKTHISSAGHSRTCQNNDCVKQHFPRIEPAVIFSITNNRESQSRLLLARQASWDKNRYSVLAGFVEPGESLENAVRREGFEEVGLKIDDVSYIASQPWPFPASLMLGFESETNEETITLIDDELEEAIWVTAQEMNTKIRSGELKLPFSVSISWHLIDRWYGAQTGDSLKSLLESIE